VAAESPKASATTAQDTAERTVTPAVAAKTAAIAPKGAAVAAVKVPAPDNERWGDDAADAKVAAAPQPQAEKADAASEVNDPQSAPVPMEEPKMATSEAEAPKAVAEAPKTEVSKTVAEAPKKLAYASPSQAAHPVDKAVTAALPQAASTSGERALPGVNANPLSVPAKASAGEASDSDSAGGYASTVHTAVKLHAGPSNGSRSIGVVPGKATVHVLNCKGWCKVSYAGKEGYIFKSFLGGHASSAPAQDAPQKSAAAPAAPAAPAAQQAAQSAAAKPAAPAPADAKALEAASERTMMRR
jgi:hypothetical protein